MTAPAHTSIVLSADPVGTGAPLWAWLFIAFVLRFATQVLNFRKPMSGATVLAGFAVTAAVIFYAIQHTPQ